MDEHIRGFEKVIAKSEKSNLYKYGIYSSRIMAVKNPEIYLQGDMLFAHLITNEYGYKQAYETGVLLEGKGGWSPPFSFKLLDFDQKNIISNEKIFNIKYPVFNFLDTRLSSIHTTLKLNSITSLEAANLIYLKERMNGSPLCKTYLIFTKEGKRFVYSKGNFYNAENKIINKEKINNPILIFNEDSVWYPLMDRDDTDKNKRLRFLVNKLATEQNLPQMSSIERSLIVNLMRVSQISDTNKPLSVLSAVHASSSFKLSLNKYRNKWFQKNINIKDSLLQKYLGSKLSLLVMKIGNYLSPNTAYLSSLIDKNNLNLNEISKEYLKYVGGGTKGRSDAWGLTWYRGVIENNIDNSYRTKGGRCLSQAVNLSSVLDMKGINNIFVHIEFFIKNKEAPHHAIVLIPTHNNTFDNGRLLSYKDYKSYREYKINKIMLYSGVKNNTIISFNPTSIGYYGQIDKAKNLYNIISNEIEEINILEINTNENDWNKIKYLH